jgi:hypothetical protein
MNSTQKLSTTPASVDFSPADVLRAAALYIERHGWLQGAFYPVHHRTAFPPACVAGAVRIAACGRLIRFWDDLTFEETLIVRRADKVLAGHLDGADLDADALTVVSTWNDEDWRTATDVIRGLRGAADEWDRTHGGTR